ACRATTIRSLTRTGSRSRRASRRASVVSYSPISLAEWVAAAAEVVSPRGRRRSAIVRRFRSRCGRTTAPRTWKWRQSTARRARRACSRFRKATWTCPRCADGAADSSLLQSAAQERQRHAVAKEIRNARLVSEAMLAQQRQRGSERGIIWHLGQDEVGARAPGSSGHRVHQTHSYVLDLDARREYRGVYAGPARRAGDDPEQR